MKVTRVRSLLEMVVWPVILAVAAWLFLRAGMVRGAPQNSVVRISSHGLSGVIVFSEPNRSLILSAGHGFHGQSRQKAIVIDIPTGGMQLPPRQGSPRLVQVDEGLDLALISLPAGPMPWVSAVAPRGYRPRSLVSVGYDKLVAPAVVVPTHIVGQDSTHTYTAQRPIPGRSGGGLLAVPEGFVVGIVTGYETAGPRRGIYSSLGALYVFLDRYNAGGVPASPSRPGIRYFSLTEDAEQPREPEQPFPFRGVVPPWQEPRGRPYVAEHYEPPGLPPPGIPQQNRPWVSDSQTQGRQQNERQ